MQDNYFWKKNMKKFLILVFIALSISAIAQYKVYPGYYAVFFKNKNHNRYKIDQPSKFLSQKAIERRKKFGIRITKQDLPVSQVYLDSLKRMGLKIKESSKWLNCAIVYLDSTTDSTVLQKIKRLSFVGEKPKHQPKNYKYKKLRRAKIKVPQADTTDKFYYGEASTQDKMLKIDKLHNLGYTGKDITIAIMDMGFFQVNKLPLFDSLWANHQILGWYDFVDNDTTVFNKGYHGMSVLSTIAGNSDYYLGTAPKAKFYLFATEDEKSEYPIEEYNYVVACEKADSLGVDMIHASLGYNQFNDTTLSYKYKDMDGNTAISTIGADIAASKGIMVTVSAGNEGASKWKYISAPADGDSVLAVGAVNYLRDYAFFSSQGPTSDGRIKPDVCAMGVNDAVEGHEGFVIYESGTSFSGPIMAGAVACLMQAFPKKSNIEIMNAIRRCASNAKKPNAKYGYGIPDFWKTYWFLKKSF
jgi:subtilisin family serine protease